MFVQGRDLTHFRRNRLQASLWDGLRPAPRAPSPPLPLCRPRVLLPPPSFPGPGTMLNWALGGSRAHGLPHLCLQPGAAPCQQQASQGTQRLRAPLRGSFLQTSTVEQSRGDRGFPDIVSPGSLGTEQVGFGTSSTNVYLHVHTIGRVLPSAEWEQTTAVLLPGPASKGKTETAAPINSATKKLPARRACICFPFTRARLHAACGVVGEWQGILKTHLC